MNMINKINTLKTQNELNEFRKTINEALDNRAKFISLCELANNASQKSFGYIKEAFETISPNLFNINGGRKIINKYTKTIKENKNLSKLHTLYENVRKMNSDSDIDFFVNNTVKSDWDVNSETLLEDTKKLGKVLAEGILMIGNDVENILPVNENTKLNNALNFVAENKQTTKNITKYSDAIKVIKEHIASNPKGNIFEAVDLDSYANNLIESFNKKYATELTEEEFKLLKEIDSSSNKEELFNKFKTDCLSKLTEMESKYKNDGNNDDSEKVSAVIEKINKKSFVSENVATDIRGFVEITKIFE